MSSPDTPNSQGESFAATPPTTDDQSELKRVFRELWQRFSQLVTIIWRLTIQHYAALRFGTIIRTIKPRWIGRIFIVLAALAFVSVGVYFFNRDFYYNYLLTPLELAFHISVSPFVIVMGALVYNIRCTQSISYGVTEIFVGIGTLISTDWANKWSGLTLLQSLVGMYVVVRGFDTIDRSITAAAVKDPNSPWMPWKEAWDQLFQRDWSREIWRALIVSSRPALEKSAEEPKAGPDATP